MIPSQVPSYFNKDIDFNLSEEDSLIPNNDFDFTVIFSDAVPAIPANAVLKDIPPLKICHNFNYNLNAESNQHCEEFYKIENNQMVEQNYNQNFDNNLNFYKGLLENAVEELEKDKFFEDNLFNNIYEVDESYEEFKKGIKTNNNLNKMLDDDNDDFAINSMEKEEIIIYGKDVNDSFIVEQFCLEELMNDELSKQSNIFQNKKEENDQNIMSTPCNENDYEKAKKLIKEYIKKLEGETPNENSNNNDLENTKKSYSKNMKEPYKNHKKIKSSDLSKKKKNVDRIRKEMNNFIIKKMIFYIAKKNKSFGTDGPQNLSNSSTKDSLSSNNASNTHFKCQINLSSDISNTKKRDKIYNITKIFKDEFKLNKSDIIRNNFEEKQNCEYSFLIPSSNINKNQINNLSDNNIENISVEKDESKDEDSFLNLKRNRIKDKIKNNMRTLGDFEKNIYREFRNYLIENEYNLKNKESLDNEFWALIHTKDIKKSNVKFEGNNIYSYSHELIKYIISKDDIPYIYEDFLKDNNFHQKYISQNKKRGIYKNNNSYKLYRKNLHKIYCKKYKESELELT